MSESFIRVKAKDLDRRIMARRTLLKQEIADEVLPSATQRERRQQHMQRLESLRRLIDHCTDGYILLSITDNDLVVI